MFHPPEEWRESPGFTGYFVSSLGRIRGRRGGVLKPRIDAGGYLQVTVMRDGKTCRATVHSLVAGAFIGPRPGGLDIDHVDGCKQNNVRWNLEYVSRSENIRRAHALGLSKSPVGSAHGSTILTEADVIEIRRRVAAGETQRAVSLDYGLAEGSTSRIVNRKNWKHI